MKKQYRNFTSARKFAQKLNLNTREDWNEYCKSGKKPIDIPTNTYQIYNEEWISWGDFLGTGSIASQNRIFCSFIDARKYVQKLDLKNQKEWREYLIKNKLPSKIPNDPASYYNKTKEWKGWGDFLGTGRIANQNLVYLPFDEARKFVQELKLNSREDWKKFGKSKIFPSNLPKHLNDSYKKEWKGWGDFLGTGRQHKKSFRPFTKARKYVQSLGIKNQKEWNQFRKSRKKPDDIPTGPNIIYKKEWKGWGDFLGTGYIANQNRKFLPWEDAKKLYQKIAKENNISTFSAWLKYVKTHKLPKGLPPYPVDIYTEKRVRKKK